MISGARHVLEGERHRMGQVSCRDRIHIVIYGIRDPGLGHLPTLAANRAVVVYVTRFQQHCNFIAAWPPRDRFHFRQSMESDLGILFDAPEVYLQAAVGRAELGEVLIEKGHAPPR